MSGDLDFLDGWLTGDPDEDSVTMEYDRPTRPEMVSVVGLAARLYLGGVGTLRRYLLAMAAFHRDAPPVARRPWLLIKVGLVELLILAVAAALVAPDAVRSQGAMPAPPAYQELG